MKYLAVGIALLGACVAAPAIAGDEQLGDDAPVVYRVPGTTVIMHKHAKAITLEGNPKITYLDKPFTYDCVSVSGCAIVVASQAQLQDLAIAYVCAYVDGAVMKPACAQYTQGETHNLQGQKLKHGVHTLQTGITSSSGAQELGCPCDVTYTIYDSDN